MIFWIFFIIAILAIICIVYELKHYGTFEFSFIVVALIYLAIWALIHMSFGINNLPMLTTIGQEELRIEYEELEKNKDNEYVRPDIVKWNKSLRWLQEYQDNFWIGPYIPNIFDQYKTIEVNE